MVFVLTEIYVIMRRYIIRRDVLEVFTLHLGFSFLWNKAHSGQFGHWCRRIR